MSVYKKLMDIQNELKSPKSQYNSFGKYNYRSCEDIQESLKPLLVKFGATVFIKDDIVLVDSRYYVKAIVTFVDIESGNTIESFAYARESEEKKGMDSAQVTGATSSYARKYALNGLFLLDDTKDNDHDSNHQTDVKTEKPSYDNKEKDEVIQKIVSKIGNDTTKKKTVVDLMNTKYEKNYSDFKYFKIEQLKPVLQALIDGKI